MKKQLWKDIWKSVTKSWGRFISIVLLMALGSFALVGLFVTGPDMRATGEHYFDEYNVADISVISSYGITETERAAIEQASGVESLEYIYLKDVTIKNSDMSVRVFSEPDEISMYELKEGRMPRASDEVVLDYTMSRAYAEETATVGDKMTEKATELVGEGIVEKLSESKAGEIAEKIIGSSDDAEQVYAVGDTIEFTEKVADGAEAVLRRHEFKIVGFVYSSEILSTQNRGETTIGTGALDSYAVVRPEVFATDYYMMAKITYTDTADLSPYTDEYDEKIATHQKELDGLLGEDVQEERLIALKATYQAQIDEANEQVAAAKAELDSTRAQLANANSQIASANAEIAANENKLADAAAELAAGENKLAGAETEIASAEAEILANEQLLNARQAEYDAAAAELASGRTEYETKSAEYTKVREAIDAVAKELNLNLDNISVRCEELKQWLAEYAPDVAVACQGVDCDELEVAIKEGLAELDVVGKELEEAKAQIEAGEAELAEAKEQLDAGWSQLDAARAQLANAKTEYANGKTQLTNGKNEYANGQIQLANAKKTLSEKTQEYNAAVAEFSEAEPGALAQIAEAEAEIAKSQKKVDNLALPTYDVDTRREIPGAQGYTIYNLMPDIIDSLARIFPVFLYFVAALVTLTTMTRFVSEERINSGTLKSLGYADRDIMKKFIVYGLIAGTVGTIIGIILGHTLLPMIAYSAYKVGFSMPELELHFYPGFTALAIVLALCSSVLPAYIVARRELREKPAELMLPKAPKAGAKILLERLTLVWRRMSFTHKVTARNIFRYKSRMWMTIVGVAGAVAILFTGFSVKASIENINERQFGEIIKYDMIVADDLTADTEDFDELAAALDDESVQSHMAAYYESAVAVTDGSRDKEEITVIVPDEENGATTADVGNGSAIMDAEVGAMAAPTGTFADYIALFDRKSGEAIELNDSGVVISERLAELLKVEVGESFEFKDAEGVQRIAKVAAIAEMYTGHFMFMNRTVYSQVYGDNANGYAENNSNKTGAANAQNANARKYQANANLVRLVDGSRENTDTQAARFMELTAVKGLVSNTTLEGQVDTITRSLNMIMGILILIAAMLAIVIIYNLTNINVMERIRELSTIKVLGFRDREVTMYIYRETWLLTMLAIVAGWGLGLILHAYILEVVPPNDVMFNPTQVASSFLIPLAVVVLVTAGVQKVTNKKLIKLDMLEALKSVD